MKIILGITGLLLSGLIGGRLSEKYRRKERFYFDMLTFCTCFRANLGFRRATVEEVFTQNSFEPEFSEFAFSELGLNRAAGNKKDAAEKGADNPIKNDLKRLISEQEKVYIEKFFSVLGAGDAESQDKEMAFYEKYFERKLIEAQETAKVRAPMVLKLSVLCGFLFCIFLI